MSLRHRVGERDGRALYSDAVGELCDGGPATVLVDTRRGPVEVARTAVVAVCGPFRRLPSAGRR
ncbi:MAG: hypothetical protein LH603_18545 [Pseudonocardia sp.]|nr:hypothetical protein [Pseudonocardia sp.]